MPRPPRPLPPSTAATGSHPLLGSAPTQRSSRFAGFSVTRPRVLSIAVLIALLVLGCLLPYLSMPYITFSVERALESASLFPAADFIRGIEPQWLPGYHPGPTSDAIAVALQVFNLGPNLQEFGLIVAVLTCWSLFQDEMNKFLWWPLHLSGWMLALGPVALLVGLHLLHAAQVSVTLSAGWIPLAVAGVLTLVTTFRARGRIDTYASI